MSPTLRTASVILAMLALIAPAAATPPRKKSALKKRLHTLSELQNARADALTLIRDDTRYIKGNNEAQREVTLATGRVSKAHARVEGLLRSDLRRLKKKKARKAMHALMTANPDHLNPWEHLLVQRLNDMRVLVANQELPASLSKAERPTTHQLEQLRLTNEYRMLMGLRALQLEMHLAQAAGGHSKEMQSLRYFDHTSPTAENRTPFTRAKKAGFEGCAVGENIAHGYRSPAAVHKGWLKSPGHHRNIVDEDWEVMGVANASDYWTQVFGRVTRDD